MLLKIYRLINFEENIITNLINKQQLILVNISNEKIITKL